MVYSLGGMAAMLTTRTWASLRGGGDRRGWCYHVCSIRPHIAGPGSGEIALTFTAMTATATEVEPTFPRYVYKILSEEPPYPLPHTLPLTALDEQDGFIHLSAGWRVPQTTSLYFGSYTTIWLLRVDTGVARGENARFKWGDPGCVHMYGPEDDERRWARMGDGVVVAIRRFARDGDEEWSSVLERALEMEDRWLNVDQSRA
jgi:Protein of unknown function (DUF952)